MCSSATAGGSPGGCSRRSTAAESFPAEVHEHPTEVVGVLLHPVIERLDLLLVEEPQHSLLQLAGSLARNDLDQLGLLGDRLVDDPAQRPVDLAAAVVDVMQVEDKLHVTS